MFGSKELENEKLQKWDENIAGTRGHEGGNAAGPNHKSTTVFSCYVTAPSTP
jgi:hypothetical protein